MNAWFDDACPKCGASNLFNNGDVSDLSAQDIIAGECYKCCCRWWFDVELAKFDMGDEFTETPSEIECQKGKPTP